MRVDADNQHQTGRPSVIWPSADQVLGVAFPGSLDDDAHRDVDDRMEVGDHFNVR